jgi:hypothetical protein
MKQKQIIQKDMGLSRQITSIQDCEFLWTILSAGNGGALMRKLQQINMLGGASLWIVPHRMYIWNINLVFLLWTQSEPNKPMNACVWTVEYYLFKTT